MGKSRYSIGLVKRDGTLYKRQPAQKYWSYARFGLIDKKGNIRRILDGIPFNPTNSVFLNQLLSKNSTLKEFEPALKQSQEKKKSLTIKKEKNELVLVNMRGRVIKELPTTNTPVYYAIRSGDNINIINVPMKYRGYLLKDSPKQKQRPQRFSKQKWLLLKKFFKTNAKGEVMFYLDNLGRIRPPELSKGKYKRIWNEEKQKWTLKRGDGLAGALFTVKDAQFKIWVGSNFMELDVNDFITMDKKLSVVSKSKDFTKIPEIKLEGRTVRDAVRNIQLDYTEQQWKNLQQKFGTLEFDFVGYFREGEKKIGFNGGGSLKGNLFDFQKDLAKEIVQALARTGNRFTALNTLKEIDSDNISFTVSPSSKLKRFGEQEITGASPDAKKNLKIGSIPKNIPRKKLNQITESVFIKIRIITQ